MCDEIIELVAFDTLILPTASYSCWVVHGCRKGGGGGGGGKRGHRGHQEMVAFAH